MTGVRDTGSEGFLDRNPHLRENYEAVCAQYVAAGGDPSEVPESAGLISQERPDDEVFEYFRRLHDVGKARS